MAESSVDMSIAGSPSRPTVDNDSVVAMELVEIVLAMFSHNCLGHELKGNGFGPCDVVC